MAVFKCKMCGGDLEVTEGMKVIECDFCGTTQTVPTAKDENIQSLFNRANTLRMKSEFDKAEAIYEKIVQAKEDECEAYWGIILCRYGIEYVEDPKTFKRIPTCHRTSYDSVIADEDYKSAIKYADIVQRIVYENEAKEIDRIQREILELSQKEEPYDVFICYKETDSAGRRTVDSAIANDIYYQLTQEGYKVFYAAITLEDKLGSAYEPCIFAALNSAKVMLAIGTKPEYFNAVWVKNEWSRYLRLMKNDRTKLLIPCYKDMDAYELPDEFAHLQAQDMCKIGFINDVVRGIKKVIVKDEPKEPVKETVVVNNSVPAGNAAPLLERAFLFLEDGKWDDADNYAEKVLDLEPKNARAYLCKLCAELRVNSVEKLSYCNSNFENRDNYKKAVRFADDSLKNQVDNLLKQQKERIAEERRIEEERLAEERRIEEERLAIERRIEEERLAEERRIREERLAEEKRQYEERLEKDFTKAKEIFERANCYNDYVEIKNLLSKYKDQNDVRNVLLETEFKKEQSITKAARLFSKRIACGIEHTIGISSSGKVLAAGNNEHGECEVGEWKSIIAVSCGDYHTVGLKADRTVIATGSNSRGQCNVSAWNDIAAVSCGGSHTVCLKYDGTVIATGYNEFGQGRVYGWSDIVKISCGNKHTVGLKANGTVVAAGDNKCGQCDVSEWKDIVAVSCGGDHTIGIKSDGTVVAAGCNEDGQCKVENWKNIVAVSCGKHHTVGLRANGTVVATGYRGNERCAVSSMEDIIAVFCGKKQTVLIEYGNSVRTTAKFTCEGCDIVGWHLFKNIDEEIVEKEKINNAAIACLEREKAALEEELPTIKGLFSGGKKAKIEERINKINKELQIMK